MFDASGSVAACNLTVASYAWTASGGLQSSGAANSAASDGDVKRHGRHALMLTVTDSAGHQDKTATVSFTAAGAATVNAPSSAGTAATACPTPLTVTPASPTVTEAFSPTSVSDKCGLDAHHYLQQYERLCA